MLSGPRALTSASEASDYLLHEYLVRNDKAHRTANRWHGGGAEALGLPERVSRRRFVALLEGHVPGTDIRLGRVVDGEHQHRPGWDCTFSAPKSVSLEALLHDNKAVMRAHDASVRAALDWIEAEFLQTRGYDPATGRRPRVKADGLVAATFRHVASRNNDPQLHTHAVIANMTRNAAGEWRSVEPTLLQRNRRLIGAWYRNDLARRLGEMGYVLVPTQVGGLPSFELAGYSPAMLEAFSTRRRDILDYMADKGWKYDAKTAQAATLHTRKRKDEPAPGELSAMWKARAEALGLARDADEVLLGQQRDHLPGPTAADQVQHRRLRQQRNRAVQPRQYRPVLFGRASRHPRVDAFDPVMYLLLLALAQHQPRRRADLAVPVARQLHRQRALDQIARHRQPRRVRPFPHPFPFRIRAGEGMDHGRRAPAPPHLRDFRRSDAARSRKASASNMERSLSGSRSYIARTQRSRNATLS